MSAAKPIFQEAAERSRNRHYITSCCCCCCCCCSHINSRIIKYVVTGQAPVTLEMRNTLGKNTNNPSWYTHISHMTLFMPPPETYKSEIASQSTMCQVHTGAYSTSHYSRMKKPTIPLATQERLPRKYFTWYLSLCIRTIDASQIKIRKKEQRRERKGHGCMGPRKRKEILRSIHFGGSTGESATRTGCSWFFDDLQQCYKRLPIHPPKHGLPAKYAMDSWPWLSRFSVLRAPVPCLLFALV